MPIPAHCHDCKARFDLRAKLAPGEVHRCPNCGSSQVVDHNAVTPQRALQVHPQLSPEDEQCEGCRAVIPAGDEHVLFVIGGLYDPNRQPACLRCYERMIDAMQERGQPPEIC